MTDPGGHIPVLPGPVGELLAITPGDVVVDATVGLGGHAAVMGAAAGEQGLLVGLDVDPQNLEAAKASLKGCACRVELRHANFAELPDVLADLRISHVNVLLADLGVSSTQLDQPDRGFSFQADGPLDMRMDPRLRDTAADLVNRLSERELSDIMYFNAQEMHSRRIARRICTVRKEGRILRTRELVDVIVRAVGVDPASRRSKIHPATRTFQAIRMEVNAEIPNLERLLACAPSVLAPGGRFGVIAFHSVEDKCVKQSFRAGKTAGVYEILTKKPIVAEEEERIRNARSRSAKLRVARRV